MSGPSSLSEGELPEAQSPSHQVELTTRDGARFHFVATPEETLLDAAARAGHFLPASCRNGSCGACFVTCDSGSVRLDACSESALPDRLRAGGGILLCCAKAQSDVVLSGPFARHCVGAHAVPRRHARLVEVGRVARRVYHLVLQFENDPAWGGGADFLAGQFVELTIPGTEVARAYSIASTPNWNGRTEYFIRHQAGGAFSAYLERHARVGDTIVVRGPQGRFTADEMSHSPRWFIAGGTGLAPVLSILGQMAELGDRRPCRLLFGVNAEDEVFGEDRIAALSAALPSFEASVCVWRPGAHWSGFRGTPVDALADLLARPGARPDIYVCGPPPLIDAVSRTAQAGGVPGDRIFSEACVAAAPRRTVLV